MQLKNLKIKRPFSIQRNLNEAEAQKLHYFLTFLIFYDAGGSTTQRPSR